jgi:twitching motility protein PilT
MDFPVSDLLSRQALPMSAKQELNKILQVAGKGGASDIHIKAGLPPVFRVDGSLLPLRDAKRLSPEEIGQMAASIMTRIQREDFEKSLDIDLSYGVPGVGRFRVNVFQQRGSIGLVFRVIPFKVASVEELLLPEVIRELAEQRRGLILVTGATGSGKSTTMASMVDYINLTRTAHIITIEDPIEFYHEHKKSTINQREVGVDVPSFSEAIRRALRQDPDVILVGELRDLETIEAAISAAETGHIVFGTLHTNSAQGTVNRIIDAFPGNLQDQVRTQLASSLIGVVAQTLLPKIGGGRCAAYEVLIVTSGISNLIRENKTFRINSAIQTGAKFGMQLMDDALFNHWAAGKVTVEDALSKSHLPDELAKRIVQARRGEEDDKANGNGKQQ